MIITWFYHNKDGCAGHCRVVEIFTGERYIRITWRCETCGKTVKKKWEISSTCVAV